MAVPGCPEPAASTASMASTRVGSTPRRSACDHSSVSGKSLTSDPSEVPNSAPLNDPIPNGLPLTCRDREPHVKRSGGVEPAPVAQRVRQQQDRYPDGRRPELVHPHPAGQQAAEVL